MHWCIAPKIHWRGFPKEKRRRPGDCEGMPDTAREIVPDDGRGSESRGYLRAKTQAHPCMEAMRGDGRRCDCRALLYSLVVFGDLANHTPSFGWMVCGVMWGACMAPMPEWHRILIPALKAPCRGALEHFVALSSWHLQHSLATTLQLKGASSLLAVYGYATYCWHFLAVSIHGFHETPVASVRPGTAEKSKAGTEFHMERSCYHGHTRSRRKNVWVSLPVCLCLFFRL